MNLGYLKLSPNDFETMIKSITCPLCKSTKICVRNIGFVNSKWDIKCSLKKNPKTKIHTDG